MAAKKKPTRAKKKVAPASQLGPGASPMVQYLVVTFTVLSLVYAAMAYWRYG